MADPKCPACNGRGCLHDRVDTSKCLGPCHLCAALPPTEGVPVCAGCGGWGGRDERSILNPNFTPCPDCASPTSSEGRS